jgi:hypothetical protein
MSSWQVVRRFCTLGLGGLGDAWLLWDPSLDSGPNPTGACGRVDGIIETCKNCASNLKIHPRP